MMSVQEPIERSLVFASKDIQLMSHLSVLDTEK